MFIFRHTRLPSCTLRDLDLLPVCSSDTKKTHYKDVAVQLRHSPQEMLRGELPRHVLTDSGSPLFVVGKSTKTTKKRLMINLRGAGEVFERCEITGIGSIKRTLNLPEGLSKGEPSTPRTNFLRTHQLEPEVTQWVLFTPLSDSAFCDLSDELEAARFCESEGTPGPREEQFPNSDRRDQPET